MKSTIYQVTCDGQNCFARAQMFGMPVERLSTTMDEEELDHLIAAAGWRLDGERYYCPMEKEP